MAQTTIDVRTIIPRERHPLIFRTFEGLQPGEGFELVNDHRIEKKMQMTNTPIAVAIIGVVPRTAWMLKRRRFLVLPPSAA